MFWRSLRKACHGFVMAPCERVWSRSLYCWDAAVISPGAGESVTTWYPDTIVITHLAPPKNNCLVHIPHLSQYRSQTWPVASPTVNRKVPPALYVLWNSICVVLKSTNLWFCGMFLSTCNVYLYLLFSTEDIILPSHSISCETIYISTVNSKSIVSFLFYCGSPLYMCPLCC